MTPTKHQQIIKDLIKQSGLSQKKFAAKHEIEYKKFNRWVTGERNIQFCTLELIAFDEGKKLTIKIDEL